MNKERMGVQEVSPGYEFVAENLAVPVGYKQTEVGVIPEDWELRAIRDVCRLINGRGFKPFEWKSTGLPIIRIQNLNGSQDFNYYDGLYDPKIEVMPDQLLFAWSGSRGTSFGPHIWIGPKGLLNYHTWKVAVRDSEIDQNFFFHALKQLTLFIEDKAHGASALVHTQKWEMEGFQFPAPTCQVEQRAIATALSDVDALLEELDRLIAKKRDIKQAAMQQLLTGETRLPGFEGEWKIIPLGSLGRFLKGSGVKRDDAMSGNIPCVRYGEIYTLHNDVIREFHSWISDVVAQSAVPIQKGDVLFAGSGETKEEIGKSVALIDEVAAYAGGDIVILRTNNADPAFLGYALNQPSVIRQKSRLGQGDAVVHISAASLAKVIVKVPRFEEQSAIAAVLSDMDTEIHALEQRRSKTAELKQGMMQELLTGRTRLV